MFLSAKFKALSLQEIRLYLAWGINTFHHYQKATFTFSPRISQEKSARHPNYSGKSKFCHHSMTTNLQYTFAFCGACLLLTGQILHLILKFRKTAIWLSTCPILWHRIYSFGQKVCLGTSHIHFIQSLSKVGINCRYWRVGLQKPYLRRGIKRTEADLFNKFEEE